MPSFNDFTFDDEVNYDVTPEEQQQDFFNFIDDPAGDEPDDGTHEDEPGAGDSYPGASENTVFNEQDELTDEETAPARPDAQTLGAQDDPESIEQQGDEAAGDDEDDESDPALVSSEGDIYEFLYKGKYQEQGQDADELTAKTPEQIPPTDAAEPSQNQDTTEVVTVFKEDIQAYLVELLDSYAGNGLEVENTDDDGIEILDTDPFTAAMYRSEDMWDTDLLAKSGKMFGKDLSKLYMKDWNTDLSKEIADLWDEFSENDEWEEFNTINSYLIDFGGVTEGIDINTYLAEFGYTNEDLI